jgi:hypothetical protein
MHDVLKQLNDLNPSDLHSLAEQALRRLETLCENWAKIAEAELGRRRSLPIIAGGPQNLSGDRDKAS